MKFIVMLFFLCSMMFGTEIVWQSDYKKALQSAKKEKQLVYVLIVSDTCKWCKKFENTTLKNKAIKERIYKEFVTVLLTRDRCLIPKGFQVTPVPRHYFTDPNGKILYSALGYRDEELFDSFMDNAQENYIKLKDTNNEISTNK